ncbi:PREDICTED: sodium-coupled monocarboxylate transporter 2-like [Nicrophorus vespilloides]|uniref:Sodium-coupled monocarboxylate transporter 2-like n=1 Tax=Nicrophorus vespilloides TaxID=110193 RepID=A0ABM1MQT5_NICVS|nr:PREDICTED: sodium-coupled monocarboxylate transporter 2-like [Nicrophorus vespilloides]
MNNCSMDLQEHQLQRSTFQWHDYVLFVIMVLISVCLGIYHGYFSKKQSVNDYLTGSRKMKVIPIAFSLTASLVSGVSMVALPADVYNFGATIALIPILVPMALLFCCQYVLPVLYNLKLTSIYEYIELRFDHRMRLISSFLYILYMVPTLPAMLYVPALSLSQGTGFSVHYFTVALSSICIFYTTVGGFKAVISTDTLQFIFMLGTNLGIMFMGVWHSGGLNNIYQSSLETGRLDLDFDLDPTKRDTFWTIGIGFMTYWIQNIVTNQTCMQKSFSLPTVKKMKKAVMLFGLGFFIITLANIGFGLIIFDEFKDCDPISSGKIRRPDEIASFYILSVTKHLPGIAGLYISGVFSGSLSSMSAAINSLSCTIFKDFVSFNLNEKWKKHSPTFIRLIGVMIGLISIVLVFLLENLGNVLPTIVSMGGIAAGPMLGLFILGLFTITANAKVALKLL